MIYENLLFSPGIALANQTLQLASVKAERGFSKVALDKKIVWVMPMKISGSISGTVGHNSTCSWKGESCLMSLPE